MSARQNYCVFRVFHADQAQIAFSEVHVTCALAVRILNSENVIHVKNGFIILRKDVRDYDFRLTSSF
jgi:hypothetical protein